MDKTAFFDKLRNEHSWGVSSRKKVPLFVSDFLATNDINTLRPVKRTDMNYLPTLNQIDANYSLANTNRAYHLHAKDNLIVAFDVEVRSDPDYIKAFLAEPAPYKEWSKHKGIHMFYQLDRNNLTPKSLEVLADRVEYKFKGDYKGKNLEFELIMNKHWITVTRNVINDTIEDTTPQWVYDLINKTSADYLNVTNTQIDLGKEASSTARLVAESLADPAVVSKCQDLTVSDFDGDDSRYEFNVAYRILRALRERVNNFNFVDAMTFRDRIIHPKDLIWAAALITSEIVSERAKHNSLRDGVPYLVYVSKRANDYLDKR